MRSGNVCNRPVQLTLNYYVHAFSRRSYHTWQFRICTRRSTRRVATHFPAHYDGLLESYLTSHRKHKLTILQTRSGSLEACLMHSVISHAQDSSFVTVCVDKAFVAEQRRFKCCVFYFTVLNERIGWIFDMSMTVDGGS